MNSVKFNSRLIPVWLLMTVFIAWESVDAADFNWAEFGATVSEAAPLEIRQSPEKLAKYVAAKASDEMSRQKVTPNYNLWTRFTHFPWQDGKCEDSTDRIGAALNGAGFKETQQLVVRGGFGLNRHHVVLGAVVNGKIMTFDAWQYGRTTDTYKDFVNSDWNGLPIETWLQRMRKQRYMDISGHQGGDGTYKSLWLDDQAELAMDNLLKAVKDFEDKQNKKDKEKEKKLTVKHVEQPKEPDNKDTGKQAADDVKPEVKKKYSEKFTHDLDEIRKEPLVDSSDLDTRNDTPVDQRLRTFKDREAQLRKEIKEAEDSFKKGDIPGKEYTEMIEQNKKELDANLRAQQRLSSSKESKLMKSEGAQINGAYDLIASLYDGRKTIYDRGANVTGSWWESFFGSSEERDRQSFEATQSSADAVLRERQTALDAARNRAESEAAQRDLGLQGLMQKLSAEYEAARKEAQYQRENSWGAWVQSVVMDTVRGVSGGFGSSFGNRLGSGIIEREIFRDYPETSTTKGTTSSGSGNVNKGTRPGTSTGTNDKTTSNKTPSSGKSKGKAKPKSKSKPGQIQPPPAVRNTGNEITPTPATPPAPPPQSNLDEWVCQGCYAHFFLAPGALITHRCAK